MYNYSVIIPFRDRYDLLVTAVESVPDRVDIQIVLIDNSETPLPVDIIPAKKAAHVDFFTSPSTKGAGCARNVGLKNARGKFLLFLDSDDYFTPNAFEAFDKYLDNDKDIVYFKSDSVNLKDGNQSNRHLVVNGLIDSFNKTGDENILRYQFVNPIAKLIRADYILRKGIQFDEIKVSNDVWFSVMSGHEAQNITADDAIVYMITAGDTGTSLTRIQTSEAFFIRYHVMVRVNKFLKTIDKYNYRIRLIGALRIAYRDYGLGTFYKAIKYAYDNKVGIF